MVSYFLVCFAIFFFFFFTMSFYSLELCEDSLSPKCFKRFVFAFSGHLGGNYQLEWWPIENIILAGDFWDHLVVLIQVAANLHKGQLVFGNIRGGIFPSSRFCFCPVQWCVFFPSSLCWMCSPCCCVFTGLSPVSWNPRLSWPFPVPRTLLSPVSQALD